MYGDRCNIFNHLLYNEEYKHSELGIVNTIDTVYFGNWEGGLFFDPIIGRGKFNWDKQNLINGVSKYVNK